MTTSLASASRSEHAVYDEGHARWTRYESTTCPASLSTSMAMSLRKSRSETS